MLFNISTNGLKDEINCILSRFTDDTELGSVTDTPGHFADNQRQFHKGKLQKFNKEKLIIS